jgi:hypothetical protein
MPGDRRPYRPGAETPVRSPLEADPISSAPLLELGPTRRPEDLLPVEAESGRIVPEIGDAPAREAFADRREQALVHPPAVHERRLAAFRGRLHAREQEMQRPPVVERVLVVPKDVLARRVEDRRVDAAADALPRVLAVVPKEFSAYRRGDPLEAGDGHRAEPAKEDRAVS